MIQPVSALTPKAQFKGQYGNSDKNPVNRKLEKRLAILNAGGFSAVAGALTTVVARSYTSNWKHASYFGGIAAVATMLFVCPRLMYRSGIKSFAKEKEMDVFTREKEIQQKLLNDVSTAIDEHHPDLQDKIDNYSKTIAKKEA